MTDARRRHALLLRRQGHSIKDIARQLNAAQSSVSIWVRDVILSEKQTAALKGRSHTPEAIESRRLARLASEHLKRSKLTDEAQRSLGNISTRELQLVGTPFIGLKGAKRSVWCDSRMATRI